MSKNQNKGPQCLICGRSLRKPESIALGIGPVCAARLSDDENKNDPSLEQLLDLNEYPLDEGLTCVREGQIAKTNIRHLVIQHSPTGFDWGYAGSAASELALNVCEHYLRILKKEGYLIGNYQKLKSPAKGEVHDLTYKIYQNFKDRYIVTLPVEGGRVPAEEIFQMLKQDLQRQKLLL